jgi:hypothetical protein
MEQEARVDIASGSATETVPVLNTFTATPSVELTSESAFFRHMTS